jgi:thiosulfate/3-mercaptopyruvate sulfurtransferase
MTDYKTVIGVSDLSAHFSDANWVILDCRFDLSLPDQGYQDYLAGHIPGAQYVDLEADLSEPVTPDSGRHPLPGLDALKQTFSRLGIDPQCQVVAYDDAGGGYAARTWWSLRYAGHPRVAVLDGGFPAWVAGGFPLRAGLETRPAVHFQSDPRDEMWVGADILMAQLGDEAQILLDSRAAERYQGEDEPIDALAGHIPGAINRPWQDNLRPDGIWKEPDVLKQEYEAVLNGRPAAALTTYCGSGVTACHTILSMAHAGYTGMRLYPGSWSEWIRDPARPIIGPD